MTDQPYADAVADLLDQGYRLENLTTPEVVLCALDRWIAEQVRRGIAHHAATTGNGHQPDDHCDGWSAVSDVLQIMHDGSRTFVMELLEPVEAAQS